MKQDIKTAFTNEMGLAQTAYSKGEFDAAFMFLERAHILGQRYFISHMVTHWWMLKIGMKRFDLKEISGQILRLIAVVPGFIFGWVPKGNTGGANVSAVKPMPLPEDFRSLLSGYNVWADVLRRVFLVFAVLLCLILGADLLRGIEARKLEREWRSEHVEPVPDFGATRTLKIMPLVNWDAAHEGLKTEAGVSYLIRTDKQTILFDLGYNQKRETPSPLEHNLEKLNINFNDIDTVFISHPHRDHVGGLSWAKLKSFSTGVKPRDFTGKSVFASVQLSHPDVEVQVISTAQALGEGIASTGPIARRLLMGRVDEQALVVHLEGKGLVVFVGCGHQTLSKLEERLAAAFDEPIYAIIGDLHYPVPKGRLKVAGIDAQRRLASGEGLFSPIGQSDVEREMERLVSKIEFLALGGHDTSDEVLTEFKKRMGDRFQRVKVGREIYLNSTDAPLR